MKSNARHIVAALIAVLSVSLSFAQQDWEGEIEDAQIVVEKDAKIELPQANRKFEKITKTEVKREPRKQEYGFLRPSMITLGTVTPRLRVLRVKSDPVEQQAGNYVKTGFGNYITPFLDAYVASTNDNKSNYVANVYHLSSANGPVESSGMSDTRIMVGGETFINKSTALNASMTYRRDGFRYYGLPEDSLEVVNEDDIKQVYQHFSPRIGVSGEAGKFSYAVDGVFDYMTGSMADLTDMNYGYTANADYELADKSSVILDHQLLMENFNGTNRTYVKVRPMYKFLHNGIHVTVGLNTAYHNETFNGEKEMHVYPEVFFNYPLVVNEINVFGGITGDLERNTFRSLQAEAPFIYPDTLMTVFNTNKLISFYGGIKGNVSQKLGYKGEVSYANYRNLPFYVNRPDHENWLAVTAENGTTSLIGLKLEGMYDISKRLVSSVHLEYNGFGLSDFDAAYGRPVLLAGVNAQYNVKNKVLITGQVNYINGLTAFDFEETKMVSLKDIIDLNFEIDYKLSDKFSTFVMLNNIVGTKYRYFMNYPTKGINGILGVTYSF